MNKFFPSLLCCSIPGLALIAGAQRPSEAETAAAATAAVGGCGCIIFVFVAITALHIALLVWVARDSKSRGMDSSVLWMLLVMVTGLIGLIIFLLSRPQGSVKQCATCGNKRLAVSAKCPHCGNP